MCVRSHLQVLGGLFIAGLEHEFSADTAEVHVTEKVGALHCRFVRGLKRKDKERQHKDQTDPLDRKYERTQNQQHHSLKPETHMENKYANNNNNNNNMTTNMSSLFPIISFTSMEIHSIYIQKER